MSKRVLAVAAIAAAAVLAAGVPAGAQTYPPPVRSITVDDTTPTPGQKITVTLRTCKPGTFALIGIGLSLVGAPRVGADGTAVASVTVPTRLRPGSHTVSGACLAPDLSPLFLTTRITVVSAGGGAGSGGGGGGQTGAGSGSAGGGSASSGAAAAPGSVGGAGAGAAGGAGGGAAHGAGAARMPSLGTLGGPAVPDDAPVIFEEAAAANGVTDGGGAASEATASRSDAGESSGPGTLSTIARVALGMAALGGVPVALAVSRRPRVVARPVG